MWCGFMKELVLVTTWAMTGGCGEKQDIRQEVWEVPTDRGNQMVQPTSAQPGCRVEGTGWIPSVSQTVTAQIGFICTKVLLRVRGLEGRDEQNFQGKSIYSHTST